MLLMHWARRAASRTDCTAGSKSEINIEMIAITTSSSISVKPRAREDDDMVIWTPDCLNLIGEAPTGDEYPASLGD